MFILLGVSLAGSLGPLALHRLSRPRCPSAGPGRAAAAATIAIRMGAYFGGWVGVWAVWGGAGGGGGAARVSKCPGPPPRLPVRHLLMEKVVPGPPPKFEKNEHCSYWYLGKNERATRAGGSGGGGVACMLSLVLRVSTRRCASGVLQHSGETMDEPALLWQVRSIRAGHL